LVCKIHIFIQEIYSKLVKHYGAGCDLGDKIHMYFYEKGLIRTKVQEAMGLFCFMKEFDSSLVKHKGTNMNSIE